MPHVHVKKSQLLESLNQGLEVHHKPVSSSLYSWPNLNSTITYHCISATLSPCLKPSRKKMQSGEQAHRCGFSRRLKSQNIRKIRLQVPNSIEGCRRWARWSPMQKLRNKEAGFKAPQKSDEESKLLIEGQCAQNIARNQKRCTKSLPDSTGI